jgi:hypothetical protein
MMSDLSLGELSIAEIWVIELPICLSDLWDPEPFRMDSTVSTPRMDGLCFIVLQIMETPSWFSSFWIMAEWNCLTSPMMNHDDGDTHSTQPHVTTAASQSLR